ncbi:hypothetical protein N7499_003031 [Penicillium canescens]|uniref:HTH CENPB-type domain-containing protein n=1 Tax=Penicillium canescens TaxID=5083 RepID=A0AAD6I9E1_PENCN|nr:uncharacterized protein N7446_012289 [Penicillium canescens]XP_058366936.1 uncharacterized protein N7446_011908 [Penicillium canescens]KAJ6020072.1 hypothetical protein N7522_000147 [Penicillium canescens]KAJ6038008.1 hypothetical protein N7460_007779 [Penicillium canescens]KAJ6045425.1 hypothetical protein N7446_012289 [Penicillium canescens]KAJ6047074.1 hypothetical protein N7446_011908 [Penicillium canescens]KAJ6061112.1 hypothetical protein N7444_001808 [Penicillium canescens]
MPKTNKEIEIQIEKAMDSLSEQSKPNIAKTAREFAVPEGRLRRRWKGGKSLFQRQPNGRRLNSIQEQALCEYINYFDTVGASINRRQIAIAANSILEEDHHDESEPPPQIGDHWLKRFLKRNPEYYVRRRKALDVERSAALDKSVVERWFQDYKQVVTEHGICQQDIYNFDETGFQIGVGRDQFIITRHPKKKLFNGSITNRESVTVLEAVSADGFACPPLIILSAKQALARWFDAIKEDEHLAVTDTGYINDTLAFQWIQLFHKWTIGRTLGAKRLVLCDRFGAHMTRQFVQFCEKNNIILFFLLSHTSHVLQPLDVGVFSVYKHWHSEAVEAATMTGCRKFSKDEFLHSIGEIRRKTFKPHTIKLGFKLTGLWPINSKLITDELESYDPYYDNLYRSNTPSINSQNTEFSTPKTAEKVRRISLRLNQYDPTTQHFKEGLAKLAKGAEAQATLALQLQREFDRTQAIMGARHARYDASRRHVRITGIMNSNQLKEIKRKEYKLSEKADQEKTRRKWKKVLVEIRKHGRAKKRSGN